MEVNVKLFNFADVPGQAASKHGPEPADGGEHLLLVHRLRGLSLGAVCREERDHPQEIREIQTATWHTFLSNIGGQIGLWLGLSAAALSDFLARLLNRALKV